MSQCRTLAEGSGDQEAAEEAVIRPPYAACHSYWRQTNDCRREKSFFPLVVTDEEKNTTKLGTVPCTDQCLEEMPADWQNQVWEKLDNFRLQKWDVYKCMEDVLEFETCDGCVEFTDICRNELSGRPCLDGIKLMRRLLPHSSQVKRFLNIGIYPARLAMKSIMELDTVLTDPSTNLEMLNEQLKTIGERDEKTLSKMKDKKSGFEEGNKASFPGPVMAEKELLLQWGENYKLFKDQEADHPLVTCDLCDEQKRKKRFRAKELDMAWMDKPKNFQAQQRVRGFFDHYRPGEAIEDILPLKLCTQCWDLLRNGYVGGGMRENSMQVDPLPQELACLNVYEQFLIARAHCFYTVVSLKPLGSSKLPASRLLKATKGSAVHLPLPLANTAKRVLDTLPMANPQDTLQIFADVPTGTPKNPGPTWRNLIDEQKVLAALKWLKKHNPLYENIEIRPDVFDQMEERGFLSLTGENEPASIDKALEAEAPDNPVAAAMTDKTADVPGQLVPQAEQHLLVGAYSVQKTNDAKVKAGDDLETYVQMKVQSDPLPTQTENIDALCCPTLFPYGRGNADDKQRQDGLRLAEYAQHRLRNKDPRFRRNLRFQHMISFQKRDRAINQGCYASTKTGSGFGTMTAGEIVAKVQAKDTQLENNLNMCLASVKGTKEYWSRQASDLGCMDAGLGPATFFLTLSCAEYHWAEMETYLKAKNVSLPGVEKMKMGELMASDPVLVSEFFHRRFNAMMSDVIRPMEKGVPQEGPLGIVEHYYWRS